MAASYDIKPTGRLPGLHLDGMVTRRFLISYPVPPESLDRFLPPGAEISTWGGFAWVSACFVNIKKMRPSFVPGVVGIGFNYLVHRTRARLPYPDGTKRETVLVLEANINRKLFPSVSRITPGVRFRNRHIALTETRDSWTLIMQKRSGVTLYEAEIPKSSIGRELPVGSRFPNIEEADRFLLGVSYGGEWHKDARELRLFAETHDPWQASVGSVRTRCNRLLESLGVPRLEADHVITMTETPHCFAVLGAKVKF
jgi:hypothetical protein